MEYADELLDLVHDFASSATVRREVSGFIVNQSFDWVIHYESLDWLNDYYYVHKLIINFDLNMLVISKFNRQFII